MGQPYRLELYGHVGKDKMAGHTLKDLRALARKFNEANHIQLNQTQARLIAQLKQHGLIDSEQEGRTAKDKKVNGKDTQISDEDLAYVLSRMHHKYFRRPRSRRRRRSYKRRRDSDR